MILDYFSIALGNLIKRRLRSWLTIIGIFIGIAAVVSLIGLGEGLRNAIMSQFSMMGSDMITVQAGGVHFGPPGTGVVTPLNKEYADKINKVAGVKFAIPRLIKSGKMEFNNKVEFGMAGSMPGGIFRKDIEELIGLKAYKGRLLKDGDKNKIVVGNNFKDDRIYGKPIKAGDMVLIQDRQFQVVGIAKKAGNFIIDNAIMINEDPLRELYNEKEEASLIAVRVKRNVDINNVKEDIEKILRKERSVKEGEEDFRVELAVNTLKTLDSTLFAVQLFVYIIASISLLVGGIGIMNTMYTAVVQRTKEIGIMKSIGARNSSIFYLFLVESGFLGMVGGIAGIIMGISLAKGLAFIGAKQLGSSLIQAHITIWLIIGALVFSFIIGTIAGITPAIRASKLHPVDALRYTV